MTKSNNSSLKTIAVGLACIFAGAAAMGLSQSSSQLDNVQEQLDAQAAHLEVMESYADLAAKHEKSLIERAQIIGSFNSLLDKTERYQEVTADYILGSRDLMNEHIKDLPPEEEVKRQKIYALGNILMGIPPETPATPSQTPKPSP